MMIPEDWLCYPITPAEAEEDIASDMTADVWLSHWRAFLGCVTSGDQLWWYEGAVCQLSEQGSDIDLYEERRGGFALVRDGEVIESIEAPWLA